MSETKILSTEEANAVNGGNAFGCKCCICGSQDCDYKAQFDAWMCWDCYQKEIKNN